MMWEQAQLAVSTVLGVHVQFNANLGKERSAIAPGWVILYVGVTDSPIKWFAP